MFLEISKIKKGFGSFFADFKKFISKSMSAETDKNVNIIKIQNSFKEIDSYR